MIEVIIGQVLRVVSSFKSFVRQQETRISNSHFVKSIVWQTINAKKSAKFHMHRTNSTFFKGARCTHCFIQGKLKFIDLLIHCMCTCMYISTFDVFVPTAAIFLASKPKPAQ